jgi:hypothetical protein
MSKSKMSSMTKHYVIKRPMCNYGPRVDTSTKQNVTCFILSSFQNKSKWSVRKTKIFLKDSVRVDWIREEWHLWWGTLSPLRLTPTPSAYRLWVMHALGLIRVPCRSPGLTVHRHFISVCYVSATKRIGIKRIAALPIGLKRIGN